MRRLLSIVCAAAAVQLTSGVASANTEAVVGYDARSAGMAFSGAAYINSASAIMHNPANLTDVKRLSIDVSFNPEFVQLKSVALGQTSGFAAKSKYSMSPLGFVGIAYKGHPRFAIGLAGLILDAGGVSYKDVPSTVFGDRTAPSLMGSATGAMLSYEVRIPIAIKVTDWLSVAGGYRLTMANSFESFKSNGLSLVDNKTNGQNYSSAQAGIMVRPIPQLQFGLAYRSRTKIDMTGTRKTFSPTGDVSTASTRNYVAPHQFTAGVAVKLIDQKLLLTGDFKYWLYADAYKGEQTHQDAMSGHIGAEYQINRFVPVRAGYFVGRSSILNDKANAFTTSPKLQMGGTIGSGVRLDIVDINAAVIYGQAGGDVANNPLPGNYSTRLMGFNVSASFKI
jgi:long-subunit fatty acid transport protein